MKESLELKLNTESIISSLREVLFLMRLPIERPQFLARDLINLLYLDINSLAEQLVIVKRRQDHYMLFMQTWEPVKPGVPKEVKGGYPETKILRVR